jgi:uncharacterized repeat protein (TIGR01451 family)
VKASLVGLILALALLAILSGAAGAASPEDGGQTVESQSSQPIIIDHTCTDLSKVPESWIEQAKDQLRLCYGHTSHGSQPVSGMRVLRDDPSYDGLYDFNENGGVVSDVLSLDDYTPSGDLGNPDRVTWASRTRTHLDGPGGDRNVVVWSWCGQVSSASADDIITYLGLMNGLEMDYPNVTFVYMTGHLDGSGEDGNLHLRNEQIREYCRANGKTLFDFADIESYDPDGNYYLDLGADDECYYSGGNWADEWCAANPGQCSSCYCAHSRSLNCDLKARAFWWMLARTAGWDGITEGGPSKTPSVGLAAEGQAITYTIAIRDLIAPLTTTHHLTDQVPAGMSYVSGTLTATAGTVTDTAAPSLFWSGTLTPTPVVTVTYLVTVSTSISRFITNSVAIAAPGYQTVNRTATVLVNARRVHLPVIVNRDGS